MGGQHRLLSAPERISVGIDRKQLNRLVVCLLLEGGIAMSKSRQKTCATTTPASILPASHALVFLAMYVAGGLSVPVLSLMLIARGATVETLPISIGITLAVTCAFEVPSGVISDVLGRRATFAASMLLHAGAYLFLLIGDGFAMVLASSVLRGLALAARTGSLEAIEIDRILDRNHEGGARLAALDCLNGRLALLETTGTAAGGMLGGMIAAFDDTYVLLIVSVVFLSLSSLTGAAIVFPKDVRRVGTGMREGLRAELFVIVAAAKRPGDVRFVLALSVSAGVAMVALETYWQLDLLALMGDPWEWALGFVSCLGMVTASVGSACAMRFGGLTEEFFKGQGRRGLYIGLHVLILVVLGSLAFTASSAVFIGLYAFMYLLLGARSVIEQTLLHNAASSRERSGMASVQSVAIRGGGVLSSALGSALVPMIGLGGVWMALAAIAAGIAAPALVCSRVGTRR